MCQFIVFGTLVHRENIYINTLVHIYAFKERVDDLSVVKPYLVKVERVTLVILLVLQKKSFG